MGQMSVSHEPVPNEQAVRYLDWTRDHHRSGAELEGPETARLLVRQEADALAGAPEPVEEVEDLSIGDATARLYRTEHESRDVVVWIHGGGWIAGDVESYDTLLRALTNRAGCSVLSLNYRLAPEHPFPAGLDDCWRAVEWATARFDHVAVGGDSSGGNLAAAIALRARDHDVRLALQILVYPVLDYRPDAPSYAAFKQRYRRFAGLRDFGDTHADLIQNIWEVYIPERGNRHDPYASPLRAESLQRVAPALVLLAEHDILSQESVEYAERLEDDGVEVTLHQYPGQIHGFFRFPGSYSDAVDALERCAEALRAAFTVAAAS